MKKCSECKLSLRKYNYLHCGLKVNGSYYRNPNGNCLYYSRKWWLKVWDFIMRRR